MEEKGGVVVPATIPFSHVGVSFPSRSGKNRVGDDEEDNDDSVDDCCVGKKCFDFEDHHKV